jgi:4-hydroxybenzoate polyprenyltransferase
VTGKLSRRFALKVHLISSVLGGAIGVYLLFVNHQFSLFFCQLFSIGALIYYAAVLKRSFLIGNITIALLTALVVWLTSAYLLKIPSHLLLSEHIFNRAIFSNFSWFFTVFSFGLTLVRELIKDMQDIEGDAFIQANTFPILLGINKSKYFVISLLLLIFVLLVAQLRFQLQWTDAFLRQLPLAGIGVIFLVAIYLLLLKHLSVVRLKWIDGSIKIAMVLGLALPYYWKWMEVFG